MAKRTDPMIVITSAAYELLGSLDFAKAVIVRDGPTTWARAEDPQRDSTLEVVINLSDLHEQHG